MRTKCTGGWNAVQMNAPNKTCLADLTPLLIDLSRKLISQEP